MIEIKIACDRCGSTFTPKPRLYSGEVKGEVGGFASQMQFKKMEDSYMRIATYDLCNTCRDNLDVMQRDLHDNYFVQMLTKPGREQ